MSEGRNLKGCIVTLDTEKHSILEVIMFNFLVLKYIDMEMTL